MTRTKFASTIVKVKLERIISPLLLTKYLKFIKCSIKTLISKHSCLTCVLDGAKAETIKEPVTKLPHATDQPSISVSGRPWPRVRHARNECWTFGLSRTIALKMLWLPRPNKRAQLA